MNEICGNCGKSLRNARELGTSGLYFPHGYDIDLCINCYWAEEELIGAYGTNDRPQRLAKYLHNLGHYREADRVLAEAKEEGRTLGL